MVDVFGWSGGLLSRFGQAPTLAAASAGLPHGAYTSLRTHHGNRVVRLADHVRRLASSVAGDAPLSEESVRDALAATLRACPLPESRLRVTWAPPRLFLAIEPFVPLPEALYRDGVACAIVPLRRERPRAKDTHFIESATVVQSRLPEGTHEGLMVAEDGTLLEGLSSNLFAVLDGELRTEEERVLPGVTRSLVLEVAADVLPVRTVGIHRDALPQVAEAFLTSVSRGVLPVVRIDAQAIGDGRPGPHTAAIRAALDALVEREAQPIA